MITIFKLEWKCNCRTLTVGDVSQLDAEDRDNLRIFIMLDRRLVGSNNI